MSTPIDRRRFLQKSAALGVAAAAGLSISADHPQARQENDPWPGIADLDDDQFRPTTPYPDSMPNVIIVRFGGGVRRLETILDPERTWCPFIYHELYKKNGILFPSVEIDSSPGIVTSHGEGTLYILTGRYAHYADIEHRFLSDRFIPIVPTVFEYFRRQYAVPIQQTLIINGEDRINEDFYTFSECRPFGIQYRSLTLSLFRYKQFLLRDALEQDDRSGRTMLTASERRDKEHQLHALNARDYRRDAQGNPLVTRELDDFWRDWRSYYGTSGLINPRKDRLLTALTLRALARLKPRMVMINYQDPDYVHWGNRSFYTRAISIIDEGVREIYSAVQSDPFYRDNTVFLVVPDCGRDSNRCMSVPFQHHFNTRSSHEIFVVASGPGIVRGGARVERARPHQQISVAGTIGKIMGFPTPRVDGGAWVLQEMFA
jgi:hypothetical protein